jgi:hypothetical protein
MKYNKDLIILQEELAICKIHVERIKMALKRTNNLFPVTEQRLTSLTEEEYGFVEILTNSFAKLQENLGQKIFPAILRLLKEDIENKSFLDRLNKLEKLEIIPSVVFWDSLREVRNNLIHEYENNPKLQVKALNECVLKCQELLNYWEFLNNSIINKLL